MKKKVLIIGPIGDFGGREIETNIIARSLSAENVKILSTGYMTKHSSAIQDLKQFEWTTLDKILFEQNFIIRLLCYGLKRFYKRPIKSYGYVDNSVLKKAINLNSAYLKTLKNELKKTDVVILCMQLSSRFLSEILDFCHQNKIPCLVRTTGTIREVPKKSYEILKKATLFIHHSESNSENLNRQIQLPYKIIDQCALAESSLLALPLIKIKPLRFGYLGRLSEEKGILPVAKYFSQTGFQFLVAGDGDQKESLLDVFKGKNNCHYLGLIKADDVASFFEKIDVLIIPSLEEAGPLVGLEAMAAGKIIISTRVGSMPERMAETKNTFWFDIEDISSLQKRIEEINNFRSEDLLEIAKNVREHYLNHFSTEKIALSYQNVVKQVTS